MTLKGHIAHSVSKRMRLSEPTTKIWMKMDLYYQQRRCIAQWLKILAIEGLCGHSLGFPGEGASNNSGIIENVDFRAFGRYAFGTLGNEANVIIWYHLVPCRLSTDLKIHDLEWTFYVQFSIFTITNRVSAIRLHIYRRAIYRIFLLYDVTSKDVRKRTVKTVIRRILQIRERIADLWWRKLAGIVGTLTNKANISILLSPLPTDSKIRDLEWSWMAILR